MKRSRPLSLFLSVLILIFLFPVVSLGASDNLIDSDLSHWQDLSDKNEYYIPCTITSSDNIYRVTVNAGSSSNLVGAVYDYGQLIAGHSYSLSFKMPTRSAINLAFDKDYSANVFTNHFTNCTLSIGIAFLSPSNEIISSESFALYTITSENYTDFFGKTLTTSFIASNFSGTPVVIIQLLPLDFQNHSFYFSDFKLVDNDDNSAELTGIKGFLHSIRWDLVGGTCEEEDCPHSSGDNPHLSLSERMSSGFASMFQTIGDKFEEGSTLNIWFNNLSDTVGNLDGSLSNLGDRFQGFIDGLGESLSIDLGNFETSVTDWFDDLKKSWDAWIDDIQQTFDDVGASITNKFQEIGDSFTEFFEKFKPRVYINFDWQPGYANPTTGVITTKPYEDGYFFEQGKGYSLITDFFTVPDGSKYLLDFVSYNSSYVRIFKYDLSGNFVSSEVPKYGSFDNYLLESKFKYIFMVHFSSDYPSDEDMNDRCNDSVLVYADEGWLNAVLFNIRSFFSGIFKGFGNLLLYFNWEGEYTNPFEREDSPIDKVSEFFDDLIEYVDSIGTSIENILDSITGGLHIFDEFTSRFPWLKGISMFCLAIIVLSRFIGL